MKKVLLPAIVLSIVLVSCLKNDNKCSYNDSTLVASATEVADMQSYLTAQSIAATQNGAGFFYKVNSAGTGASVTNLCTNVTVKYKGKLTNGTIFDSTATGSTATFQLGQVIPGWQKGVPLVSKGGKITLYIPPSLGYGAVDVKNNAGVTVIPANSKLIFDIELVDVFN